MPSRRIASPAFGQADLSNCEREQIHLAASIQPHGALLLLREPELVIVQASANAGEFLRVGTLPNGTKLATLPGNLERQICLHLGLTMDAVPVAVRATIGDPPTEFDALLHRPPDGGVIVELERMGPPVDPVRQVDRHIQSILVVSSIRGLCDETALLFRELSGYDRVMVYRFDRDGHGEVIAEQRRSELEPFLGNRYPASDIPQIARRLYERNRVRVISDIDYMAVPLTPRLSPISGSELDMSLCVLRSSSPIHVQYLKNMGVRATLVISLMVAGKLWGLVSCHHYAPRFVHFEMRAACELLAEAVSTRIAAMQSFAEGQAQLSVRRLEQRMIESITREGDWRSALFDGSRALLQPLGAGGAALLFEDQVMTTGDVPGTQQLREIGQWLDARRGPPVIDTASLGNDEPEFATEAAVASGLVAAPISQSPGEYLIWFRPERIRTIVWGGNPFKPVLVGDDPSQLSPRRSFAQWHQLVEGTAEPWSAADLTAARLIGESVTDVVLQFRSVRMLIAKDQLDNVSRQVQLSEQPVLISDPHGKILLANKSFLDLLPPGRAAPQELEGLVALVADPADMRRRLRELMKLRRAWRGEVLLETVTGTTNPVLVRADPVFISADRVLGFVMLFTNLTERKAAEAARRRFQEGIVDGQRLTREQLDSRDDLMFRSLLNSIVENAQLAALEITDCLDVPQMPDVLESVRESVNRSREVLGRLQWHASRRG